MNRTDWRTIFLTLCVLASGLAVAGGTALGADDTAHSENTGADGQGSATNSQPNATGASGQQAVTTPAQPASDDTITIEQEYHLTPAEAGRIDVTWTFNPSPGVSKIETALPENAADVSLDGFVREDGTLVWEESDQDTETPTIRITVPVNQTSRSQANSEVVASGDSGLRFMDTGDWALFSQSRLGGVGYTYFGEQPDVVRKRSAAGQGVVSDAIVYLGPYEMTNRSAHDQQFRLVVPDAATLAEEESDVFESVTGASDSLRVGNRDDIVTMFAAPHTAPWGQSGLQIGDSAFYSLSNETVDTPENTWVHEYVHTRQRFNRSGPTQWFTEASADYYAARLTFDQERVSFDEFQRNLGLGADDRYDDVFLADSSSWHDLADYEKGGLVAGELDRQIRVETGSSATLQSVFREMNEYDGPIPQSEFLQFVENAGGESVRDDAQTYTESTAGPEMWSENEHSEAFGSLPARFAYRFPSSGSDGIRVRGPYRNETATGTLVTGERLLVDVNVTNVGGTQGSYDLTLTRDGVPVANRTGTAAAGESVTETVEVTFEGNGTYLLSTGSDGLSVEVSEPAAPTVTQLFANQTSVTGSGTVELTAIAANEEQLPAEGNVSIERDGETLLTERVSLVSGDTRRFNTTVRLDSPGTVGFRAGNETLEVTVEEATTDENGETDDGGTDDGGTDDGGTDDGGTDGDTGTDDGSGAENTGTDGTADGDEPAGSIGPGFGVLATVVALLLLAAHRVE